MEDFTPMKTPSLICAFSLITSFTLVSCSKAEPTNTPAVNQTTNTISTSEVAVINTTEGTMVVEFWPDVAPATVANFKKLAGNGFYDGTCFHRIIKGFMIQGGDPNTKDPAKEGQYGQGGPGYTIKGETNARPDRGHQRGVLSMANSGSPDTAGSQFFICLAPQPQLNGGYTTFGKVIKGDDVLEKIGNAPCTGPNAMGEFSIPKPRVGVESIKIAPADSVK
ncbi:MAG TPA: peptidylprolyl isomerase [Candidatus Limnocylindrales bacterium]|nr:peptidylprolyl isomerase [Candidatus Limnocylindrales bacterium]